ncbi:MAG: efflux RND transporter periplasmic adaptor subunit [Proteobacteria bacterium]|nr:efflux RND transporter periplasmic adaptor subunit [Pseudomonadota bacterium]
MNLDPTLRGAISAPRRERARALPALACALALCLAACARSGDNAPSTASVTPTNVHLSADQQRHISTRTLTAAPLRASIEAVGAVDFDNDRATSVVAPFSGPVARVLVQPGQQVRKGEALATVDSSDYAAAVDAYAKAVATAKNLRAIADADKDLVQHKGVSGRENAQAQTDAAGAEVDRDAALQALLALGVDQATLAQIASGKLGAHAQGVIRAPIAGTVAEKLIAPGTLLQTGSTACFTLADLSHMWVLAQVSVADAKSIAVGDPVEILGDANAKPLEGVVDNIAAIVDPDTRAVIARIAVANPDNTLRKQMYVRVRIHSKTEHTGLEVPVSAILRDDENLPFVFVVANDGSYARRRITLGARDGDAYEIASGLASGERIVVEGGLFMQFMQSQ